jgi:two-component system nitrogen regulation sensor histidine kinase NtrY
MGSNNFRLHVVLRIVALLAIMALFVWSVVNTGWQVTPIACAVLFVLQVLELVYFVEGANRHFTAFLDAIAVRDFSQRYNLSGKGNSFEALGRAFNQITQVLQQLNTERAAQHQLLEALVEHVGVAVLCIDDTGRITLMNRAAQRLFNAPYIHNASALAKVDSRLPALVKEAVPGESQLIELVLGGQPQPLSMFTTKFELLGVTYSLVSLQDIRDELESRELDSWQKLIKVLTHEIMNSVTPIVSLSTVIKQALVDSDGKFSTTPLSEDERMDLVRSLVAIEARGQGLVSFVQSYNNLAQVPRPYITTVPVAALLERVGALLQHDMERAGIAVHTRCDPPQLGIRADVQQVEQILINLLKNAREAINGRADGRIAIDARPWREGEVKIVVSDNGDGIAPDKLQDVFVPFYTSKKDGSGIGLSISRQLMLANKGHISVASREALGSEFTLVFRQG